MVCTNTNNMRHDYEAVSSMLIEVLSYKRAQKLPYSPGRQANISGVDFSGGRGSSGIYLRWYHPKEFKKLSKDHKYELVDRMHSNDGKKLTKNSRMEANTNKMKGSGSGK